MQHIIFILLFAFLLSCQNHNEAEQVPTNSLSEMKTITQHKTTVKRFFQLLEEENINDFVDLFAKSGTQINPYASGLFPDGAIGHDALLAYWKPVPGNFDGMSFTIETFLGTEDPQILFVQYTGKIKLKGNAGFYENLYYSTFKFDNKGKIVEYVEIFNPVVAAKAFNLTDSI